MANSLLRGTALIATALLCTIGSAADARTLLVAASGVDDAACGEKATPCRTLTRTIANAAAGDTILVGPGRYGDLDGDGLLGEPGEEPSVFGARYTVVIDKPLTVVSRDGASTTIIDAGGADRDVVRITAADVVFGKPKKGFTLRRTQPNNFGVNVLTSASRGTIAGNRAVGTYIGFFIKGADWVVAANQAVGNGQGFHVEAPARVVGNEATGNMFEGLFVNATSRVEVVDNLFVGNGFDGVAFNGSGGGLLSGNVASSNGDSGFLIAIASNTVTLTGNVASGNAAAGFFVNGGTGNVLTKNAALANSGPGVEITASTGPMTLTSNDFIGNDRANGTRCGVFKFTSEPVVATGSFWGAPTGPGAEPADEACDDTSGNNLGTTPFSTKEIKVKTTPPKIG